MVDSALATLLNADFETVPESTGALTFIPFMERCILPPGSNGVVPPPPPPGGDASLAAFYTLYTTCTQMNTNAPAEVASHVGMWKGWMGAWSFGDFALTADVEGGTTNSESPVCGGAGESGSRDCGRAKDTKCAAGYLAVVARGGCRDIDDCRTIERR